MTAGNPRGNAALYGGSGRETPVAGPAGAAPSVTRRSRRCDRRRPGNIACPVGRMAALPRRRRRPPAPSVGSAPSGARSKRTAARTAASARRHAGSLRRRGPACLGGSRRAAAPSAPSGVSSVAGRLSRLPWPTPRRTRCANGPRRSASARAWRGTGGRCGPEAGDLLGGAASTGSAHATTCALSVLPAFAFQITKPQPGSSRDQHE